MLAVVRDGRGVAARRNLAGRAEVLQRWSVSSGDVSVPFHNAHIVRAQHAVHGIRQVLGLQVGKLALLLRPLRCRTGCS